MAKMIMSSNFSDDLGILDVPVVVNSFTILIGLAAVFLNLLVIFAYTSDRKIRSIPVNFFILNLSISDGMTGINLLIYFIWIQQGARLLPRSNVLCTLWGGFGVAAVLSSTLLVILISWDRLKMVTDPFKYRQLTRRRVAIQVLCIWIYILLYVTALIFLAPITIKAVFNRDVVLGICIISTLDSHASYISISIDFLIPLTLLIIINGLIIVRIRRVTLDRLERQRLEVGSAAIITSEEDRGDTPIQVDTISSSVGTKPFQLRHITDLHEVSSSSQNQNATSQSVRREFKKMHKTIRLLLLFVSVYMLCWFPFYLGLIARSIIYVEPWINHLLTVFVGLNSVINPFLYAFMSNKYRERLSLILRCRIR
ncbi:Octopamine receptor beta-2R [Holothuria leucospilota]|uniref:Octopamine receptor beta-2R n=1 Tax=Holothuria leucospilota TaxID=206669 RepID=A0A9Q1HGH7_HOLLE|nr:Octopamine receptor beta-2R [Holothuria leucospilota]